MAAAAVEPTTDTPADNDQPARDREIGGTKINETNLNGDGYVKRNSPEANKLYLEMHFIWRCIQRNSLLFKTIGQLFR